MAKRIVEEDYYIKETIDMGIQGNYHITHTVFSDGFVIENRYPLDGPPRKELAQKAADILGRAWLKLQQERQMSALAQNDKAAQS